MLPFSSRPRIPKERPDRVMTAAILDRLLHRSVTINIQGESYRLKEHRKAGFTPLPQTPQKGGE